MHAGQVLLQHGAELADALGPQLSQQARLQTSSFKRMLVQAHTCTKLRSRVAFENAESATAAPIDAAKRSICSRSCTRMPLRLRTGLSPLRSSKTCLHSWRASSASCDWNRLLTELQAAEMHALKKKPPI